MIYINHNKKAIFIHIPKTGGSYIGPTLVKYYGFVSYLELVNSKRPDHNNFIIKYNNNNNNYFTVKTGIYLYDNSFFNKVVGIYIYCSTSNYFNEKMNMDEEKWNTYTKFCFIRHPYDRAYSGFNHINKVLNLNTTFENYMMLENILNISNIEYGHIFMEQTKHIEKNDGTCAMNIIGRFENLEDDFKNILQQIGFTQKEIIHKSEKKNVSNKTNSNQLSITIGSIKEMNKIFINDFSNFHYKKLDL